MITQTQGPVKILVDTKQGGKKEVELILPHYRKSECHWYKIFTKENAICVTEISGSAIGNYIMGAITISFASNALENKDAAPCSEKDFMIAYEKASAILAPLARRPARTNPEMEGYSFPRRK